MVPTLREGTEAVKEIDNIKPITLFALLTIALVTFLGYMLAVGLNKIEATTLGTQQNLQLHHDHTEKLHQDMEYYMKSTNGLIRELCVQNAKSTGSDNTPCFKD